LESRNGRDHLDYIDIDERIRLELILGKLGWRVWTGLIWLRIGTIGGLL
jgi:hypothetical protein